MTPETFKKFIKKMQVIGLDCQRDMKKIHLIAVSKNRSITAIKKLAAATEIKDFAENYVQEFLPKYQLFPNLRWHFIGQLQSNKVKQLVGKVLLIHSVDSLKLAQKINAEAKKQNIKQNILWQIKWNNDQKGGSSQQELLASISQIRNLTHLDWCGLMMMASTHASGAQIDSEMLATQNLFKELIKASLLPSTAILSMGMSHDYACAIKYGATHLRLGSRLFDDV